MPQPPKPDESRDAFIKRCMRYMADKEKTRDHQQQLAVCYSMWEEYQKGRGKD